MPYRSPRSLVRLDYMLDAERLDLIPAVAELEQDLLRLLAQLGRMGGWGWTCRAESHGRHNDRNRAGVWVLDTAQVAVLDDLRIADDIAIGVDRPADDVLVVEGA